MDDDEHQTVAEYALEIEELEVQIRAFNDLKSGVYKRAKIDDVNVTALRTAIGIRRKQEKDPETYAKLDRKVHEYLRLIDEDASRVRARGRSRDGGRAQGEDHEAPEGPGRRSARRSG